MKEKPEIQNTKYKGAPKLHNDCIPRSKIIILENFDNVIVENIDINSV